MSVPCHVFAKAARLFETIRGYDFTRLGKFFVSTTQPRSNQEKHPVTTVERAPTPSMVGATVTQERHHERAATLAVIAAVIAVIVLLAIARACNGA
jgi:hypothetical protein